MRYHDKGKATFSIQPMEQLKGRIACLGIKVSGRFVCKDDLGSGTQSPGDRNSLLFPAGEFRGAMHEPGLEPHLPQQGRGDLPCL